MCFGIFSTVDAWGKAPPYKDRIAGQRLPGLRRILDARLREHDTKTATMHLCAAQKGGTRLNSLFLLSVVWGRTVGSGVIGFLRWAYMLLQSQRIGSSSRGLWLHMQTYWDAAEQRTRILKGQG